MTRKELLAALLAILAGIVLGFALQGWRASQASAPPHGGIGTAATATATP